MQSERLGHIYTRLSINGTVTPSEVLLLVRDYDSRISKLEKTIEELERTASDRGRTSKVSKRKIPAT